MATESAADGGRFRVYASRCARLDSDVIEGGGSDDTAALQEILDQAPRRGGLHLIMDGAALVRGLDVHGNTTIECESQACGFFLAPGSNRSVVQNAHPSFGPRRDRHITLLGGTYNHNCSGQLHHVPRASGPDGVFGAERWVMAMEFYGVEDLTLRDLTIRNQRTFALLAANWYRVTVDNMNIELPDIMTGQNQDGLHFWGPGQYLTIRNIKGCSGDDFIALAPDENDGVSDITDVLVDGVYLEDADQGIRMLSRDRGRLDRVVVRNVLGTYKSFGFYINPWFPGPGGNFGSITVEHVDLRQTVHKYEYTNPFLFRIGGHIEALTLRDIRCHHPNDGRPIAEVGIPFHTADDDPPAHSRIGALVVDGLQVLDQRARAEEPYLEVRCPVDSLVLRDVHVLKQPGDPPAGCLLATAGHAHIGRLQASGLSVNGLAALIDHRSGAIDALSLNDVLCTGMAGPLVRGPGQLGPVYAAGVHGAPAI
ncbi:MAG: hypothetical protein ABIL09_23135 [Gemmatimonadota bacterium]